MHYKAGRQNHDFQIAHFLVGSCHTADAAYALLKDQYEDRDNALKLLEGSKKKELAKRLRAQRVIDNPEADEADRLEAEAEILDIEALEETTRKNVEAAEAERKFLGECIAKLQPYRKYAHLTDAEAAQAAQRDEWRFELMRRAENFLITSGTIPHDHYNTMRMHPDFEKVLLPYANNALILLQQGKASEVLEMGKKFGGIDVIKTLQLSYEPVEEVKPLPPPPAAPALDFRRRG